MLCSRLCSRNPHCTPPTSVFLIISIVVYIFPLATHTNFTVLDAILSPEWEYHFYAYNSQWSENEEFCKSYQVTSIPFTSFLEEEHYHLIIQKQKRKDAQSNL